MENNGRSRPRGRAPNLRLEMPGHRNVNSFSPSHYRHQTTAPTAHGGFNSGTINGTPGGTSQFSPQMLRPEQTEIDRYHNSSTRQSQLGSLPEEESEHQVLPWLLSQQSSMYSGNPGLMTGSHRRGSQMLPYTPESLQPFENSGENSLLPSGPGVQMPIQSPVELRSSMMAPPQNPLLSGMTGYENPLGQQYNGSLPLYTPSGSSSAGFAPYPYTPLTTDSEMMPAWMNKSQSIASPSEVTLHGQEQFICEWKSCNKVFPRHDTFKRHVLEQHVSPYAHACPILGCDKAFPRHERLQGHIRHAHPC